MARYRLILVLAVIMLAAIAPGARAHAFLDTAQPAVGSAIHAAPSQVRLHFTEALEPVFSAIEVVDEAGQSVANGKAAVDAADATYVSVALKPLPPGKYRVEWRVVSADSHSTEGHYTFELTP